MEPTRESGNGEDPRHAEERAELRALARLLGGSTPPPGAPSDGGEPAAAPAAQGSPASEPEPRAEPPERVPGESLGTLLTRRGTLPPVHALEIVRQVAALLQVLHARGRGHGDLTPHSVWLEGRVPWDERNPFGVRVRLPAAGRAPDAAGRAASAGPDLRAAGALLAEALTGTRFGDAEAWDAAELRIDPDLRALVAHALRAPLALPDARALRAEAERLLTRRTRRPLPLRLALGAGFGLALVLGGLLWREHAGRVTARAELAAAQGTLAQERAVLAGERVRHERELEDLRAERELPVACAALDRILQHIEEGDPAGAEAALASARALSGLDALGFDAGYLDGLLALRASLEQARATPDVLERARLLLEARGRLAAADEAGERFRLEGARWLALDLAPRPARAADCARWHEHLAHELARLSAGIRAGLEERWSALEASADDDPAGVVLLARWFGDARVRQYLARLPRDAAALRAALAPWLEGAESDGSGHDERESEGPESDGPRRAPSESDGPGSEGLLPDRRP